MNTPAAILTGTHDAGGRCLTCGTQSRLDTMFVACGLTTTWRRPHGQDNKISLLDDLVNDRELLSSARVWKGNVAWEPTAKYARILTGKQVPCP